MRIFIIDRFDIVKEPPYIISNNNEKQIFAQYLYKYGKIKCSVIVLLTFSKNSQKHIFYRVFGVHGDKFRLMDDLTKICENYAYLYEIESNSVSLDAKVYVTQALEKLNGVNDREYSIVTTPFYGLREKITNRISSKYYKLYYTIMEAWEKFWMAVLGVAFACLIFIFLRWIISDEVTIRYELGTDDKIEKIVANGPDESVMKTTNMSPEKILAILDSLNQTIKKYPDPRTKK